MLKVNELINKFTEFRNKSAMAHNGKVYTYDDLNLEIEKHAEKIKPYIDRAIIIG